MFISSNNDPTSVFDQHYALKCPHCGIQSNISAIAIPRYEYVFRFHPEKVGTAYSCDNCRYPIFLRFKVAGYESNKIRIDDEYEEIERPQETYELKYLPSTVAEDFAEALTCYSNICYNAFAAMCRRCIQSALTELGAEGKDRVMSQLKEIQKATNLDAETYELLKQIIISGHDGAHPHLPKLSAGRAGILLELMKDVLYQLFIRQAKIQEAITLRQQDAKNSGTQATSSP